MHCVFKFENSIVKYYLFISIQYLPHGLGWLPVYLVLTVHSFRFIAKTRTLKNVQRRYFIKFPFIKQNIEKLFQIIFQNVLHILFRVTKEENQLSQTVLNYSQRTALYTLSNKLLETYFNPSLHSSHQLTLWTTSAIH